MITIDKLKEFGANVDEGLGRCFGNEALYLRLVAMIPGEVGFDKLSVAIGAGNLRDGFEAAHGLKGALGNLSLSPLYDEVCEITDLLRANTEMDYTERLNSILAKRDELKKLCE